MSIDELKYLFNKYLLRNPNSIEYSIHQNKNYADFEIEISNCEERKFVLKNNRRMTRKIALLLSGHIRNLAILSELSKIIENYDIDVFVFSWDNLGIKGNETNKYDKTDISMIQNHINKIPNVRRYKIENNLKFLNKIDHSKLTYFNYSSPEIFLKSQLYSVYSSFELMDEYKEKHNINYDLVLKSRMDLKFIEFNPDTKVFDDINNNDIIFVSNRECRHNHPDSITGTSCMVCDIMYYHHGLKIPHINDHSNIICDIFAYGGYSSMKKYCSLYHHYDDLNESFLEKNLTNIKRVKVSHTHENNVYKIHNHNDAVYYFNCSYPERLLQTYLSDFMLVESRKIKMMMTR